MPDATLESVDDLDLDNLRRRLNKNLAELSSHLRDHGETHWADTLQLLSRDVADAQSLGVERLMNAFGGAGSLNDLVLSSINGHTVRETEVNFVNEQFQRLRAAVWSDARALRTELRHR